jgi:hypothetical protein
MFVHIGALPIVYMDHYKCTHDHVYESKSLNHITPQKAYKIYIIDHVDVHALERHNGKEIMLA